MTPATTSVVTPLTRFGRVPTRTTSSRPAAATAAAAVPIADRATPVVTVQSMIVCLPDGLPSSALSAHQLDRHFGVRGTLQARFWAIEARWLWQNRQLIAARKGRPTCCAGGSVALLDLAGMRYAAAVGAGIRHQLWHHVVNGTPPARPWHLFRTRHAGDPTGYPLARAEADFFHQPRVNAIRLHNAAGYGAADLQLGELEMFQAGPIAYQHYSAGTAVCADALLTSDGHRLAPASDALAHRVTYLEQAGRYLDTLAADQRLLAVTV